MSFTSAGPSTSSSSRHHKHHRSSRHDKDRNRSRRSRSRSRSPKRYFSSLKQYEKPRREYEIEIEALQSEARDFRMQIDHLHTIATQSNVARVEAESRAAHWEHETNRVNVSYQDVSKVLIVLRQSIDEIERDKQRYMEDAMKSKKERDIANATSDNFRQQMEVVSERNTIVVKKCEGYVEENKKLKEKVVSADDEMKKLKTALENSETERDSLFQQNQKFITEINQFREKEEMWQLERKELERQLLRKEALSAVERKNVNASAADNDIKQLELIIDSLHSHYEMRLKMLEQQLNEIPCDIDDDEAAALLAPSPEPPLNE